MGTNVQKICHASLIMGAWQKKNIFFVLSLTQGEGEVYGKGCKIFTIAGPVILFGILSSWVLGLLYWIGTLLGVV